MSNERQIRIRPALREDSRLLASLIDEYAVGHPGEGHPRTLEALETAFFSERPLGKFLLAETAHGAVGFMGWARIYDLLWATYGGQPIALYVKPQFRGRGVGAMLIASVCAAVRAEGGQFLLSSYENRMARLYERVALADDARMSQLSGAAFLQVADLAGVSAREIVRRLPDKRLNWRVIIDGQTLCAR